MMSGISIEEYLAAQEKRQIKGGKSGAEVWEAEGGYVLKHVREERLAGPEVFALYRNEAYFYQLFGQKMLPCLPEVLEVQISDYEILILMKKYRQLPKKEISDGLLRKIMGALALVHGQEPPAFLGQEQKRPEHFGKEQTEDCVAGWRSVLAEHPGAFDEGILMKTAAKINDIISWHQEEERVLCHGDFHWDNLLRGDDGEIVVCDWQGVNVGGASGDVSFFLSRLGADGISVEPEKVVELYCQERLRLTGKNISSKGLLRHMKAANAIVTFQCWHQYLHGCSCENVRGIYGKMAMD